MPGSASDDKLLGHLLLVEDDTRLAELIARFLGENGFLVDLAHNGVEALRRLREQAYDFIICDLMLPDTPTVSISWKGFVWMPIRHSFSLRPSMPRSCKSAASSWAPWIT